MKNLKLILLINVFFVLVSCDSDSPNLENNTKTVQSIANEYGYKVSDLNPNDTVFKVSNLIELENILESIRNDFETPKTLSFGNSAKNTISINRSQEIQELNKKLSFKIKKLTQNSPYINDDDDPPYKYSTTVFFDNTFPSSNVYLTINYNTNSLGQMTSVEVVTGTWGFSFGNTYSQTNVVSVLQNGIFVFQVSGQFKTEVGIGAFSMSNSHRVKYTGNFSGLNGSGSVRQRGAHEQGDDKNEPKEY